MTNGPTEHQPRATLGILRAARRRRTALALCVLLVPIVAVAFSLNQAKKYTATATLLFQNHQYAQGLFGTSATYVPPETDPTRAAATDLSLVQQSIIAQKTAQTLGGGLTQFAVESDLSINAEGQADLVQISATTGSPSYSATVANTYANQFIDYRREADSYQIILAENQIASKLAGLSGAAKNTPAAKELAAREQDLQIYASLQTGNAQLSQPAQVPVSASSPRPVRNGVIGVFVGLLLGISVALVLERFDRRIRDVDEFNELFDRPLLGTVPQSRAFAAQRQKHVRLAGPELETFRTIRIYLRYFNVAREIRSVVVNSAVPGEGKSTVSWNLAAAASGSGQRVLLVEADMRRPVLGSWLGLGPDTEGLSDYLAGQRTLQEVIQRTPAEIAGNDAATDNGPALDVIIGGRVPPNPSDLLESPRLQELLEKSRLDYDLVVIDTPPSTVVSDAVPLLRRVDGVIVVVRVGKSRRDHTRRYAEQLTLLGSPVLGIVVNAVHPSAGYYGYGYQTEYSSPEVPGSEGSNGAGQQRLVAARSSAASPDEPPLHE